MSVGSTSVAAKPMAAEGVDRAVAQPGGDVRRAQAGAQSREPLGHCRTRRDDGGVQAEAEDRQAHHHIADPDQECPQVRELAPQHQSLKEDDDQQHRSQVHERLDQRMLELPDDHRSGSIA